MFGVNGDRRIGGEQGDVGRCADAERAEPEQIAGVEVPCAHGADGHSFDGVGEGESAAGDQRVDDRPGGFQSGDAEGSAIELAALVNGGVGGVIGRHCLDDTGGERCDAGLDVGVGAEGRIDLGVGVVEQFGAVAGNGVVGEEEMMRGDLGGDA